MIIRPVSPASFTEAILAERARLERNKYPNQETVDKCILLMNQDLLSCVEKKEQVRQYFEVRRCPACKQTQPYISGDSHGLSVIYVPTDAYPDIYYWILGDILRNRFLEEGWVVENEDFRKSERAFEVIHPLHIKPSLWSRFKKWLRREK